MKLKLLALILLLGLSIRLIFLGSIPAGFSPDEASQAYTAYSLLQTGKDEWGIAWPIVSFKSFLDYKAPLQTYLMMPSIALFGLNEFAARLPSAIFGTLAILAVFLLASELFPRIPHVSKKRVIPDLIGNPFNNLPLYAALFLALSPWHIQFSRTALEVNLTSFLFPLGLYFFLQGLRDHRQFVYASLLWGFSLYAYHSTKVFVPLFAISMVYIYRKQIFDRGLRPLIPSIMLVVILISPLGLDMVFGNSAKRGGDLLITNLDTVNLKQIDDQSFYSPLSKVHPKIPRLFHRKIFTVTSQFAENYLSYFSLPFWFTEGGREITYSVIPGRGLLYFWMLPLVLYGLFLLIRKKDNQDFDARPLILWLLLAAIPAALTKEGYRPNRAGSFLVVWEIIAAFGAVNLLEIKFKFRKLILTTFIIFALVLTIFYLEDYYFNSRVTFPKAISYGWRDAMKVVSEIEGNYQAVLVEKGTQSQVYVAFYQHTPPEQFQLATQTWDIKIKKRPISYLDQMDHYRLGDKYIFETLDWQEDRNEHTLYIAQKIAPLPTDRHTIYQVLTPTGEIIMEVFDFKK
ncbi:MAG: hypothetical protein UW68_C0002G0053 [Candidatus Collierbacteria bacterium GW2011_GWB1_44_6]|uniref:Glycosyltransferase RgtA/B/C/D-like domain-containing protein n=2 Tax=Candidatus Collieribacteriota TaxID=1752725 RepID=A0A0G1MP38_9BACT|nr:MAG: hypothetical protein UV68_C0003G0017 [Candidatus Collierbacteria bacterium GW2011_GWC2_43_12]KKT73784.1 MAG: hypothetical protein UW68_C0002G0053 [Candidatus Collierbacteria bacterium GW2011_GWB1_44_6]KKT83761.1 MAG: hypothetical protein UW80_C0007G0016 [Microgenomates group bacterium GW2011_GWC1_44_9]